MKTAIDALLEALEGLLADYVCIAESGDCGNWDAEEQPAVIKARAALAQARAEQAEPVADGDESLCANCGKPSSEAQACISDYPEEGEWFCSEECKDLHDELGCPHEHHNGYRHPSEARRLVDCENVLRSLASWLGVGGYNAPIVDAKLFEEKIRSGIQDTTPPAAPVAKLEPLTEAEIYKLYWSVSRIHCVREVEAAHNAKLLTTQTNQK